MAITTAMRTQVGQLYVALFGRAPDADGLGYWVTKLGEGTSLSQVAQDMYNTTPARASYPTFFTNEEIVAKFYTGVLGRTADTDGAAYWLGRMNATGSTAGSVIGEMISSVTAYTGTDAAALTSQSLFNNKVDVGLYYAVEQLGSNVATATSILAGVDSTAASVISAKASADAVSGQAFTLTTAVDNGAAFTGTASADAFSATSLTLNAGDVLNGGLGVDTLTIIDTGTAAFTAPAATVTGIENIVIRNTNGSTPVTGVTGVTAQKQVVTITTIAPTATTDDVTVTYGSLTQVVGTSGGTNALQAAILAAAINGLAGATVAVVGATTATDHIITVTAPVAGTALPFIGFSAMTVIADAPTIAFTTPNIALVTAVTEVLATASQTDTVAATRFTGAESFTTDTSTGLVNFTGLTAAQTATMKAGSGGMGAGFGATVAAGTININGGTTAGNVAITGSALTSATINSTGAAATSTGAIGANTIGTLTGAVTTTTSTTINATSGLTLTGAATNLGATVTVNGAGNVNLFTTALEAGVTTLNAAALTGTLTVALGSAVTQTVTGGSGNDVITTGAILTTGSVNGGNGTDTLVVGAANQVNTVALAAKYTNFETIRSAVSLDMSLIAGITGLQVAASDDLTFSAMSAAQAANVTLRGTQTTDVTFAITGAATVGTMNTLGLSINDGAAALSTITAADISAAGVENVTIAATDNFIATTLAGLTGLTSLTTSGAGTLSLTTGALATNVNASINTSNSTGTVTINADGVTGNGMALTGSATKANNITGTDFDDVIVGGAAVDTLTGGDGKDTLTGGAGIDIFVFNTDVAAELATADASDANSITDYSGDILRLNDGTDNYAVAGQATTPVATSNVAIDANGLITFDAADDTLAEKIVAVLADADIGDNELAIFNHGSDTYVFGTSATATAADHFIIKLVGVTLSTITEQATSGDFIVG